MRQLSRLLGILLGHLRKPLVWRSRIPDVSDDPQVTKAIADKIVNDARKHRMSIEEEEGEEED
jgi:hypothetical protein